MQLTAQAEVAVDYFELRSQDALIALSAATVKAYSQSLDITRAQYETGMGSEEAVAQAQVQLQTTQAQATNLGIARAQYEHAIAVLVGQSASSFTLPAGTTDVQPPAVPLGVPSQLLERRPDVAADERLVAQANAQIGVEEAAYFPTLTLSASAGFESSSASDWLKWPSRFWSVGPSLSETIFDGGLRSATVAQYRAAYDQSVATYRQTVLSAFQQVEDNLAGLRILSQELGQQDQALASSQHYVDIATDRYKTRARSLLGCDHRADRAVFQPANRRNPAVAAADGQRTIDRSPRRRVGYLQTTNIRGYQGRKGRSIDVAPRSSDTQLEIPCQRTINGRAGARGLPHRNCARPPNPLRPSRSVASTPLTSARSSARTVRCHWTQCCRFISPPWHGLLL